MSKTKKITSLLPEEALAFMHQTLLWSSVFTKPIEGKGDRPHKRMGLINVLHITKPDNDDFGHHVIQPQAYVLMVAYRNMLVTGNCNCGNQTCGANHQVLHSEVVTSTMYSDLMECMIEAQEHEERLRAEFPKVAAKPDTQTPPAECGGHCDGDCDEPSDDEAKLIEDMLDSLDTDGSPYEDKGLSDDDMPSDGSPK